MFESRKKFWYTIVPLARVKAVPHIRKKVEGSFVSKNTNWPLTPEEVNFSYNFSRNLFTACKEVHVQQNIFSQQQRTCPFTEEIYFDINVNVKKIHHFQR